MTKTVDDCVHDYNELVTKATSLGIKRVTTVKSFDSLKTGLLACQRLQASIKSAENPSDNTSKENTMSKNAKKNSAKKTAKKAVKKTTAKKAKGAPRSKFDPAAKITWIAKENPMRKGSGRFERVEGVRKASGKTVETYLKTGAGGTLSYCVKNKLAKVS